MFIIKIAKAFSAAKIPYAIVGGYAVALHGAVRGTIDLDCITILSLTNFQKIERALNELGFQSKLPVSATEVFKVREEYIQNRNLIAWSFYNSKKPAEIVDIIITEDLKGLKTITKRIQGEQIKILAIKDLIAMKKKSNRAQDKIDIKALETLE